MRTMKNPMSWLTGLLTRRAAEQTRTITEFAVIDGVAVDGSGQAGNRYRGGMSIPGAWRAANLIADLLGSVPWDAYREYGDRPVEKLSPPPLLEQPAPPDTRVTTFSSMALDYLWHGNAIGLYAARNAAGWPTALLPVPAEQVSIRRVPYNSAEPDLPAGSIEYQIGSLRFSAWDVLHVKGPCEPGALRGMGILEAHQVDTIGLAREQNRQARALSQHGVPTGVLKSDSPDLTEREAKDLKAKWLQSQRDRTIAVLNSTTSFQPLSWNPEQLQLVEARRFTLTDLELIFGLPVGWLGGMNSARQYSNIEMDAVNLIKFTLSGPLARFEQALTLAFPRGTYVRANLDAILRADTLTRYQAHAIALDKGFLTKDEVRDLEHRPPLPEPARPPAPPAEDDAIDDEETQP